MKKIFKKGIPIILATSLLTQFVTPILASSPVKYGDFLQDELYLPDQLNADEQFKLMPQEELYNEPMLTSDTETGEWVSVNGISGGQIRFDSSTGTITDAERSIETANIPNEINGVTVTMIGDSAFWYCNLLTNITIPDSVTTIGASAFYSCDLLTNITIPESVTTIGDFAFASCDLLTNITIPESVTVIESYTFSHCFSLTDITIPDSVTTIGASAFAHCNSLANITIPDSATVIEGYAFYSCDSLTNITIPNSVTTIGASAFVGCNSLKSIKVPENVSEIGIKAFDGVEEVIISENNQYFSYDSGVLFNKEKTELIYYLNTSPETQYIIPDSVTTIGGYAFSECYSLTNVIIPDSVTKIGEYAFYSCYSLVNITIPDSVTMIGAFAFGHCRTLTDIIISNGITSIEEYAFESCYSLTSVKIPDNVVSIGERAFDHCISLTNITIPDSVTTIGDYAFSYCDLLTSVTIPENVNFIGGRSFGDVVEINVSENNQYYSSIDGVLFNKYKTELIFYSYKKSDTEYVIPDSVTTIGDFAFTDCFSLTNITIPNSVTTIGNYTFYDCVSLIAITIPNSVTTIGSLAFSSCVNLQNIIFLGSESEWNALASDIEIYDATVTFLSEEELVYPEQIINFTAVGNYDNVQLGWSISSEVASDTYKIYRKSENQSSFTLIKTINNRNTLNYTDETVSRDTVYTYYIITENDLGLTSEPSNMITVMTAYDTQAPSVIKITPDNLSFINKTETITVTANDNVMVGSVELYYSLDEGATETFIASDSSQPFSINIDTTVIPNGEMELIAYAYDTTGNKSSGLKRTYMVDNIAPEKVSNFAIKELHSSQVTLEWGDVLAEDKNSFTLQQKDGENYKTIASNITTLGYNVKNLQSNTEYVFRVAAVDNLGNIGEYSDELFVTTNADDISPVIISQSPSAGRYNKSIIFTAMAEDLGGIQSITIQYSTDGINFVDLHKEEYTDFSTRKSYTQSISLTNFNDGDLYLRAIATDFSGNISNTSETAPFIQYYVDNSAPAIPENFSIEVSETNILLSWTQGAEDDLRGYTIYRANTQNGEFLPVKSYLASINWYDTSAKSDTEYFYKIAAIDLVGNISGYSEILSAKLSEDVTSPEIIDIEPKNDSVLGTGYRTILVSAMDNVNLEKIVFMSENQEFSVVNTNGKNSVQTEIPLELLNGKDEISISCYAVDTSGNISNHSSEVTYSIDLEPPVLTGSNVFLDGNKTTITWYGSENFDDIAGYKIYRKNSDEYYYIGARSSSISNSYVFIDYLTDLNDGAYDYKIEIYDNVGNMSFDITNEVIFEQEIVNSLPKISMNVPYFIEVGIEQYFDATTSTDDGEIISYFWDFGDGTTSSDAKAVKKFNETGVYDVTLTLTDDNNAISSQTFQVEVKPREAIGTIEVTVKDDRGNIVKNAPVYFALGSDLQKVIYAGTNGVATYSLPVGNYLVGSYTDGYLPATEEVNVVTSTTSKIEITIIEENIVTGEFEVKQMDFDEIVAAGIDISDEANRLFYKVNIKLTFGDTPITGSYVKNENGEIGSVQIGDSGGEEKVYTAANGEQRQIQDIIVIPNIKSGGEVIAIIDVPVEASILKEFFDVKLHIINNADEEFELINNSVNLNVPEGMTLMTDINPDFDNQNAISFPVLIGGETKTLNWVLRGDTEGEYHLSADYNATLDVFDEPISAKFETKEPIVVNGLSGFGINVEVNDDIQFNTLYFNVGIESKSSVDINNPNINIEPLVSQMITDLDKDASDDITVMPVIINVRYETSDGNSMYLPIELNDDGSLKELPIVSLGPGEAIYYEYVAYNVIDYDGIAYFNNYAADVLEGDYQNVTVTPLNMDLYSKSNYLEKYASLYGENQEYFEFLTNNENFYYMLESESTDYGFGRLLYDISDIIFNLDISSITGTEKRELVKTQIMELMLSDYTSANIDYKTTEAEIEVTTETLVAIIQDLENNSIISTDQETIFIAETYKIMEDEDIPQRLVDTYKCSGWLIFFESYLDELSNSMTFEMAGTILEYVSSDKSYVNTEFAKKIAPKLSFTKKLYDATYEIIELSENNQHLYSFLKADEVFQEQIAILDLLIEYSNQVDTANSSVIGDVALAFKQEIQEETDIRLDGMGVQILEIGLESGLDIAVGKLLSHLGSKANLIYFALGAGFNIVDYIAGWNEKYTSDDNLDIASDLSKIFNFIVLSEHGETFSEENAYFVLSNLRYLIQTRAIGEQAYYKFITDYEDEFIKLINEEYLSDYKDIDEYFAEISLNNSSIDDYFDEITEEILIARDRIYNYEGDLVEQIRGSTLIIDSVRTYTTLGDWQQESLRIYDDDSLSSETKSNSIYELYTTTGMADMKEGVKYDGNPQSNPNTYAKLIKNDLYLASNYTNWLNESPEHRALLDLTSLVYGEIYAYINPINYLTDTLPETVKFKEMFYHIISEYDPKTLDKEVSLDWIDKAGYLTQDINLDDALARQSNGMSNLSAIFDNVSESENITISLAGTELSKIFNMAGYDIAILECLVSSFDIMVTTEMDLQAYANYIEMFHHIAYESGDELPSTMKAAAAQIHDEFDKKYVALSQEILSSLGGLVVDETISILLEATGQALSVNLSNVLAVHKVSYFVSDLLNNFSGFSGEVAITEGYAILAEYYSKKLEEDREAFINDESLANAWQFYYDYEFLRQLRIGGEKAFLEIHKADGLHQNIILGGLDLIGNGYHEYSIAVSNNIALLTDEYDFKWTYEILNIYFAPDLYSQKIKVESPTDVEIYINKELVFTINDGKESDEINEYGRFASIFDMQSQSYVKFIYLNTNDPVDIVLVGTDIGLVNVSYSRLDENDELCEIELNNIGISKDGVVTFQTSIEPTNSAVDSYGDGNLKDVMMNEKGYTKIDVSDISVSNEVINLEVGSSVGVSVDIAPTNATYQDIEWKTENHEIATIHNGKITANKEGSTVITVTALDGSLSKNIIVNAFNPKPQIESTFEQIGTEINLYVKSSEIKQSDILDNYTLYLATYENSKFENVSLINGVIFDEEYILFTGNLTKESANYKLLLLDDELEPVIESIYN